MNDKIQAFIDANTYSGLSETLQRLVRVAVTTDNLYYDTASARDFILGYQDELITFFADLYNKPGK